MNELGLSKISNKHLRRSLPILKRYSTGILAGMTLALIAILALKGSENRESHQIFKQEGAIDFKNASILGNPGRVILKEEESKLSKAQRDVLDAQTQLKNEVQVLKSEIQQLKSPGIQTAGPFLVEPVPGPSQSPVQGSIQRPSQNTSILNTGVYGPVTPPSPASSPPPTKLGPGDEFNHTQVSDQIHGNAAAPESRPKSPFSGTLGFSNTGSPQRGRKPGVSMVSFPVKSTGKVFLRKPGIILPSGSYVKGTLLTGIEAPEGKTYPVLMQLDFAYVIPNEKRLDLAGCFMIAKAQGDLSTERVQMQAIKLSCVSRKGGMFEREVNGFVADNVDNSFAVIGTVNTKQDRVAATAFLSSIVSGIGKAIQQAQSTQQATPLGGAQSIITGDQMKYIGAGGVSESASMVTQWYLKQAQNLLPTINVGSGQEVWVVMQDQVDLPKDYFTQNTSGGSSNASIYSHFTRLID
jgi:hypothetical protein